MSPEVIKEFLVGLGFDIDESGLAKFSKAITSATLKVAALYGATKIASAGIVAGISEVSKGFEQMGYEYHIIAPAINKALVLRQELLKSYKLAGINIQKVVRDSVKLNLSLDKTKFAFQAIYKSVASRFFEKLTKSSDIFRDRIYANMPKIQKVLETMVKFIFKALDATTTLGERLWSILGRVYDFFVKLDEVTGGWSTKILAAIAIWKLLNLSFLATPLGILFSAGVALLTLYDDFKTFQEGGKSFFNWSSFIPVIDAVTDSLSSMWSVLKGIGDILLEVAIAFGRLLTGDLTGFWNELGSAGDKIIKVFGEFLGLLGNIIGAFAALGGWIAQITGLSSRLNSVVDVLSSAGARVLNLFGGNANPAIPAANPIGPRTTNNSQSNQNVNQQTSISIQGVPNAQAAGDAVSNAMSRQNFDLVRNLGGAIRAGGSTQ
jgi:phage-related protein